MRRSSASMVSPYPVLTSTAHAEVHGVLDPLERRADQHLIMRCGGRFNGGVDAAAARQALFIGLTE